MWEINTTIMLLMIQGESPMLERSGVASNEFVGGANSLDSRRTRKCSMTINGHDNEGLTKPRRVLCERILSSTQNGGMFKDIASTHP